MATKAIPVVAAKVAATLADYPAYVKPSAMTGWGSITLAQAQSIRFYSDSGLTTELAREIVTADEIHVKATSLTTSTIIYADYDGVRSDYATSATYGAEAVWSDYEAVLHMEDATTDSTGNGSWTSSGGVSNATGQVGGGQQLDGTDGYIFSSRTSLNNIDGSDFTISSQLKVTGTIGYNFIKGTTSGNWIGAFSSGTGYGFIVDVSGNTIVYSPNVYTTNAQNYFMWTREGTAGRLYTNDSATVGTVTHHTGENTVGRSFIIGARFQGTTVDRFNTAIYDEFRIRLSALSQNWRDTEYNNQDSVGTFWGTVTDAGGGVTANNSARRQHLMMM